MEEFIKILDEIIRDEDNSEYNVNFYKSGHIERMKNAFTEARKKWLEEEIGKLREEYKGYAGFQVGYANTISRLEAELKALDK